MDYQKLGPALLIASSLVLAIRTARWSPMHSDGLAHVEWEKEVEHSVRIAKIVLSHLTPRSPELSSQKTYLGTYLQMRTCPNSLRPARQTGQTFHRLSRNESRQGTLADYT